MTTSPITVAADTELLELLSLIAQEERELYRLREQLRKSEAQVREDRLALRTCEKRRELLLKETITDRPLFSRPAEQIPVTAATPAAVPTWPTTLIGNLELEDETITVLDRNGVRTVVDLMQAAVNDVPYCDFDQAVDVATALRTFRKQLRTQERKEFDAVAAEARDRADAANKLRDHLAEEDDRPRLDDPEPPSEPPGSPETSPDPFRLPRCPDCGGDADKPNRARKPGAKVACHIGLDGKARKMDMAPEEVRAKREAAAEIPSGEDLLREETWAVYEGGKRLGDVLGIDETQATARACRRWPNLKLKQARFEILVSKSDELEDDELHDDWSPEIQALMADPAVNENGVYTQHEVLEIPIPKTTKCTADIRVAKGADGRWRSAYTYKYPTGQGSSPVKVDGQSFGTREAAVRSQATYITDRFVAAGQKKAAAAVTEYLATAEPERPAPLVDDWESISVADLELTDAQVGAFEALGIKTAGQLDEWLKQVEADEDDGATVDERYSWVYRASSVGSVREALEGIRQEVAR